MSEIQGGPVQPGETVRVQIRATLVEQVLADGSMIVAFNGQSVTVPPNSAGLSLASREKPVDGVPQAGELWTDNLNTLYFTLAGSPATLLISEGGNRAFWYEVHRGPTGPIRRVGRPAVDRDHARGDHNCDPAACPVAEAMIAELHGETRGGA